MGRRSLRKGFFIAPGITRHLKDKENRKPIKVYSRGSIIIPDCVGRTFKVHNGKTFNDVHVVEDMIGHCFGEFSPTRKPVKHAGSK